MRVRKVVASGRYPTIWDRPRRKEVKCVCVCACVRIQVVQCVCLDDYDDTRSALLAGVLVVRLPVVSFALRASWCLRRESVWVLAAMTEERVEAYSFASPGHEMSQGT